MMPIDEKDRISRESSARYLARLDWMKEACFKNPFEKGSWDSICYLSEAQKIRFEMEVSL